jgi:hypothetical protein
MISHIWNGKIKFLFQTTNQFCTFQAETRRGKVSAHRMIHKLFSKRQLWPRLRELRPKPTSTHGFCPPWTSFPARLENPRCLMMKSCCIPLESQTRWWLNIVESHDATPFENC